MTVWTELFDELRKKLTKKEVDTLQSLIDEKGSLEDVIVDMLRKALNPDLLSVNDIELCMQKAMKIGAYVTAVGGSGGGGSGRSPEQIAREVVEEAYSSSPQQESTNPLQNMLKQMADAISTAVMSEVTNKIQNIMPVKPPTQQQPQPQPTDNGVSTHTTNTDKNKKGGNSDVFTGDE